MTKATIYFKEGNIVGFQLEGHSGYGSFGNDIVCAAISTIAQATARGITDILGIEAEEHMDEIRGFLRFMIVDEIEDHRLFHAQTLLKTMQLTLKDIQSQYKNFLKVCTKDVDML